MGNGGNAADVATLTFIAPGPTYPTGNYSPGTFTQGAAYQQPVNYPTGTHPTAAYQNSKIVVDTL